jgi:prevent-host-death family protein
MGTNMDVTRDIQTLSTFKRQSTKFVKQVRATGEPLVLTINGKAALVVLDAANYQAMLEERERLETIAAVKRGLESMKKGQGVEADKFWSNFFTNNGIPQDDEV